MTPIETSALPNSSFGTVLGERSTHCLAKSIRALLIVGLSLSSAAAVNAMTVDSVAEQHASDDLAPEKTLQKIVATGYHSLFFNPWELRVGFAYLLDLAQADLVRGRYDTTNYDPGDPTPMPEDEKPDLTCDGSATPTASNHPVAFKSGNKVRQENDFGSEGEMALGLTRYYSAGSAPNYASWFGSGWSSNLEHTLYIPQPTQVEPGNESEELKLVQPQVLIITTDLGKRYAYEKVTNVSPARWQVKGDSFSHVTRGGGFFYLNRADGSRMKFSDEDRPRILEIANAHGIKWNYTYNYSLNRITIDRDSLTQIVLQFNGNILTGGRVSSATDPQGKQYNYGYMFASELSSVDYPGVANDTREYEYNSPNRSLTGIKIGGIPYQHYEYYDVNDPNFRRAGKARLSELAGGAERMTFDYTSSFTPGTSVIEKTIATNVNGISTTYSYQPVPSAVRGSSAPALVAVDRASFTGCGASAATYAYDANGFLDYTVDFEGVKTDYTYAANGHLTEKVEGIHPLHAPDGLKYKKILWDDVKNRVSVVTEGEIDTEVGNIRRDINRTTFQYHSSNNATWGWAINRLAVVTKESFVGRAGPATEYVSYRYELHPSGSVKKMVVDGPLSGAQDLTTYNYSQGGNLTSVVNAKGHTTSYVRNNRGQTTQVTEPNGKVVNYIYDDRGRPSTVTAVADGKSIATQFTYDRFGSVSLVKTDGQPDRYYQYDNVGRMSSQGVSYPSRTVSGGSDSVATTYTYNDLSKPIDIIHEKTTFYPAGPCTTPPYCSGGGEQVIYDLGSRTTIVYDEVGRMLSSTEMEYEAIAGGAGASSTKSTAIIRPGSPGRTTTYSYDSLDRIKTVKNHLQEQTTFEYDSLGRQTRVTRPDNLFTTTSYGFGDALNSRRITVTPPSGGAHVTYFDGLGNTLKQISPDTGTTTYSYVTGGQLELAPQI